MASNNNNNNWIAETVADFIHSAIWAAPIQTFIEEHCAAFDYDDDDTQDEDNRGQQSSIEEQQQTHLKYQQLVDSLIKGLGHDLSLDEKELKTICELPTEADNSVIIDESFEQLYCARNFQLFQEMMRRKNLILQLQALVSLQLQWGLLKYSDTGDDLVLSLLLQATKSPSRRGSQDQQSPRSVQQQFTDENKDQHQNDDDNDDVVLPKKTFSQEKRERVEPRKSIKQSYRLPDLRRKDEMNVDWYRDLRSDDSKRRADENSTQDDQLTNSSAPQTIGNISEDLLREKLRELTVRTNSSVDDETAAAMKSRKDFLRQQRDLLVEKQRSERKQDIEQQTRNARPQSAAHVARKAMATTPTNQQIPDEELAKRRAMVNKLKRAIVDKQ